MRESKRALLSGGEPGTRWFVSEKGFGDLRMSNQAYIIGCQRSGTTLLRLVLECHSKVQCFDEATAYRLLAANEPCPASDKATSVFKIPRWTEQMDRAELCDYGLEEKASRFYWPPQKILYVLRDVRDVVTSMLGLRMGQQSWLEVWGVPILNWKFDHDPDFAAVHGGDLMRARSSPHLLVAAGALYWKYKTMPLFRYLERGYPLLGVCYENLVKAPVPTLQSVCDCLQLDFEPALLNHHLVRHSEVSESGLVVGDTNPQRPIDAGSVGRAQSMFTPIEMDEIDSMVGDLPDRVNTWLARTSSAQPV